ncbi:MAG: hypothetical protein ABEJ85_01355 [Haloarculaceae archaeon]
MSSDGDDETASLETYIPDPSNGQADVSGTTDDDISESVRDRERRIALGELLFQTVLLLGFLVCVTYLVLRLGQILF